LGEGLGETTVDGDEAHGGTWGKVTIQVDAASEAVIRWGRWRVKWFEAEATMEKESETAGLGRRSRGEQHANEAVERSGCNVSAFGSHPTQNGDKANREHTKAAARPPECNVSALNRNTVKGANTRHFLTSFTGS